MRAALVALAVAGVAAAGCSDGGGTSSASPGASTRPAEVVAVPAVTGMAVGDAYQALHDAGLRVAIPREFAYGFSSQPVVTEQMPGAGTEASRESSVTLTLGKGPAGRPTLTAEEVSVPDVTGMTAADAGDTLAQMGLAFHIAKVPPLAAADAPTLLANYRVIAQTVEPGAVVSASQGRRNVGLYVEPIG